MGLNTVTSLSRSGLKDWYIQRLSALVLLAYILFLVGFSLCHYHDGVSFYQWHALFASHWMKVFTLLAVISLIAHAWVGIWTILTDYVHCALIMGVVQSLLILAYIATLAWVVIVLWF
ncbi:succinate dehydrogenase, hydrophobic membrane anchor protein [Thiotrichales bacterium 19X7-9]|nr:succinate dehydrogenase, hydrophobic membrane anchor protein [Thiotrichales bacterium 19X7-9]TNF66728.1 MAG: succinate dehydrogenase, hydrophobic membrane anchor protein [Gammaproteobacteria bacterium]UTW42821.1 succinate dehydrogenase, hydrophobic membrane anchor protein [bacterium SCSIO 12844]